MHFILNLKNNLRLKIFYLTDHLLNDHLKFKSKDERRIFKVAQRQ